MNTLPELMTLRELSGALRIHYETAARLVREGELPAPVSIGGARRWRAEDVARWIANRADTGTGA